MPRAEMPPEDRDRVLGKFLPTFNAVHGAAFIFAEQEPASDPSCDYLCRDPGKPGEVLKIQHTDAWTDPESERVRPRFVEEGIVRRLEAELRARNVRGFHVSLTIDVRPPGRDAQRRLADQLWMAVEYATRPGGLPPLGKVTMRFDRDDVRDFYDPIREYVASLEVIRLADQPDALSIGYSPTNASDGVLDPVARAINALNPKDAKLGRSVDDLVLLIRCNQLPFSQSIDLPVIRRELEERRLNFREVWVVNDFADLPPPLAMRVWSPT